MSDTRPSSVSGPSSKASTKLLGIPDDRIARVAVTRGAVLFGFVLVVLGLLLASAPAVSWSNKLMVMVIALAVIGAVVVKGVFFRIWNVELSSDSITFGYWNHKRTFPWSSYQGLKTVMEGGRGGGSYSFAYQFLDPRSNKLVTVGVGNRWGDEINMYPAPRGEGRLNSPPGPPHT